MPLRGFFEFNQSLQQGQHPPHVIVAYGYYEFLGEKVLDELVKASTTSKSEFNYQRIYLDEEADYSWEQILAQVQKSVLFFQSQRIVTVTIRHEKKISIQAKEKELIREYLDHPNPHVILYIFLSLDMTPDDFKQLRKTKLDTFLKVFNHENVVLVDLDRMNTHQVKTYIKDYFKQRKIAISSSAIEKIMEIKGDDVISILKELTKLELRAADKANLDSEDIDEMVSGVTSHSIWDLSEAIEREDASFYLETLRYLFINGIKPAFISSTLIAYYHKIYTTKFLLKHHFPIQDIGKVLQHPSFLLPKFIQMVKNFSDYKIREILKLIYKLDYDSKTGGEESARILLQKFIFSLKGIKNH